MDRQPILKGQLVWIKPLRSCDFDKLFSVASDSLIWEQHPESTRYRRDVFEKFFAKAMESGGALVILDAATSEFMGSSRYYDYDQQNRTVFIGYTFLARKYWGGRHNSELKDLMLTHAFQYVDRVMFHVGEKNFRSQKALLKIGAQQCGNEENGQTLIFRIDKKSPPNLGEVPE